MTMTPRTVTAITALALGCRLFAQVSVDWTESGGLAIALDQQNNVFTVNYDPNLGGDITLTKRNANGAFLWDASFDQTSTTMFDKATWVATDPQGNAIVTGTVMSGFTSPVNANSLVMKFDPAGNLLWRQVYESFFDGSSTRKCVVDKASNIYVVGIGTGPNGQVTKVKKFAPNGTALWSWFDVGIGAPVNIKFTPDSNLVIAHRGIVGSVNGYTRIDRNGNTIWSLGGVNSLTVGDAAGDAFGNTYVVHGDYLGGAGSVIRKLSPTGTLLWQNVYPITAYRVEVGTDNAPVVSGFPFPGNGGAAFLKTDPNGTQLWSNANADGPNNFLLHAQMMLDASNNAYLCAGVLFAMGICKVHSDGTGAWYITAGTGGGQAFALGTDNNVYVTGGSTVRLGQATTGVQVSPRVFLEGPFNALAGSMSDGLRAAGLVPLADPYPGLGYVHTGPPSPSTTNVVLSTTGTNAIVDHVLIELRDDADNTLVLASRTALVQRDGDVVDVDGTSPVSIAAPAGNYFVAVRHRNHLPCMTASAMALNALPTALDFTSSITLTYGTAARKSIGGAQVLWMGDATFNDQVKYAGSANDRDAILVRIGGAVPTNTVSGYFTEDVTMDGTVKYAGTANDRDPVLVTIGGTVPTAVRNAQLP